MLSAEAEAEVTSLARRLGEPRRWMREYAASPEKAGWVKKMLKRPGEVSLVVPGAANGVWLHTKEFYPPGVYRLPSGGIHEGESVESAAFREAFEEMGFKPDLALFLGLIENIFEVGGESSVYPTYIFETSLLTGAPHVVDLDEPISGFRLIDISELAQVSDQLNALPPHWQPWGHFRAASHALVLEALKEARG